MLLCKLVIFALACCFIPTACTSQKPAVKSGFEYRDVYLPENTGKDVCKLSKQTALLNRVDNEWGIWGHNLEKVLGGKLPDDAYSMVDGKRNKTQLCFSSPVLFKKLSDWIVDNYGYETTTRFAVLPKDNKLCCTCDRCKKLGNTQENATSAVTDFVIRLSKKFPKHLFFTSFYHSTSVLPKKSLPKNVGILVSAYTWQLRNEENEKSQTFKKQLNEILHLYNKVYIWDYVNNFEDYFTPFPCIALMQQRLAYYSEKGVKGVFFNGSGYDYSSFSDLKVYALTELMENPNKDWKLIVREFFSENYPKSGKLLSDFWIEIEHNSLDRKKNLNLYSAVDEAIVEYLDPNRFVTFYDELGRMAESVKGREGENLKKLYSALSLTRLEIAKLRGEKMQIPQALYNAPSKIYSEEGWKVEDYIKKYGK